MLRDSGINSFTTTYIIEPAANANKYGNISSILDVINIVIIAEIGSTIPEKTPYKKASFLDLPIDFKGIEIIAPSGIF